MARFPDNPHAHDHNEIKRLVNSINTHGWHGVVQASLTNTVSDSIMKGDREVEVVRYILINGHDQVYAEAGQEVGRSLTPQDIPDDGGTPLDDG